MSSRYRVYFLIGRESVLSVTLVMETMKKDIDTMEKSLGEISSITSGWNALLKPQSIQ